MPPSGLVSPCATFWRNASLRVSHAVHRLTDRLVQSRRLAYVLPARQRAFARRIKMTYRRGYGNQCHQFHSADVS